MHARTDQLQEPFDPGGLERLLLSAGPEDGRSGRALAQADDQVGGHRGWHDVADQREVVVIEFGGAVLRTMQRDIRAQGPEGAQQHVGEQPGTHGEKEAGRQRLHEGSLAVR